MRVRERVEVRVRSEGRVKLEASVGMTMRRGEGRMCKKRRGKQVVWESGDGEWGKQAARGSGRSRWGEECGEGRWERAVGKCEREERVRVRVKRGSKRVLEECGLADVSVVGDGNGKEQAEGEMSEEWERGREKRQVGCRTSSVEERRRWSERV